MDCGDWVRRSSPNKIFKNMIVNNSNSECVESAVGTTPTPAKVMNTKTQKESANRDWRDYEWRIVVRFDWTCEDGTEDVDIKGYVYDTKQNAIMDIRRSLDVYIDYFRNEEGWQVSDVYFDGDYGHGEIVVTEGCVVSMWVESNKLPW